MKSTTIVQFTWEELMKFADEVAIRAIKHYQKQFEGEQEMTVPQAAAFKRVDPQTIRNWINDPVAPLPAKPKNKRAYLIKKKDLETYKIR